MRTPSWGSLTASGFPRAWRFAEGERVEAVASSLSLRSISWKVGQLAGPVLVGAIWDATTVLVAFLTAAGLIVVSAAVFARVYATNADVDASSATPSD